MDTSATYEQAGINLNLADVIEDAPEVRASLARNGDEVDELHSLTEAILRSSRSGLEAINRLIDVLTKVSPIVRHMGELRILKDRTAALCISTVADYIDASVLIQERIALALGSGLLIPAMEQVGEEIAKVKEEQRMYEKSRERYEATAAKFAALPRWREAPLMREDAFSFYHTRRDYYQHLVDYTIRISSFKANLNVALIENAQLALEQILSDHDLVGAIIAAIDGAASASIKRTLEECRAQAKGYIASLDRTGRDILDVVRTRFNPDAPFAAASSSATAKGGYLYLRRQKGIGGTSWKRVYLSICSNGENGSILKQRHLASSSYYSNEALITATTGAGAPNVSPLPPRSGGRKRDIIECSFAINILLCEVRPADSDRRNCFAVATAQKVFIYQAESEQEMRDWMRIFESTKNEALSSTSRATTAPPSPSLLSRGKDEQIDKVGNTQGHHHLDRSLSMHASEAGSSALKRKVAISGREHRRSLSFASQTSSSTVSGSYEREHIPSPANDESHQSIPIQPASRPPSPTALKATVTDDAASSATLTIPSDETLFVSSPILYWVDDKRGTLGEPRREGEECSSHFGKLYATERAIYLDSNVLGIVHTKSILLREALLITFDGGEGPSAGARGRRHHLPLAIPSLLSITIPAQRAVEGSAKEEVTFVKMLADEQLHGDIILALYRNAKSPREKSARELQSILTPRIRLLGVRSGHPESSPQASSLDDLEDSEALLDGDKDEASKGGAIELRQQRINCGCADHLERTEIDIVLPISVDELYALLLADGSSVTKAVYAKRGYRLQHSDAWAPLASDDKSSHASDSSSRSRLAATGNGGDGGVQFKRSFHFIVPINNPLVKVKDTECFADQVLLRNDPSKCYVMRQRAQTPKIIYGDSFLTMTHFCLTHHSEGRSRLRAHTGMVWLKSTIMKGVIRSTTLKNLADYMADYLKCTKAAIKDIRPNIDVDATLAADLSPSSSLADGDLHSNGAPVSKEDHGLLDIFKSPSEAADAIIGALRALHLSSIAKRALRRLLCRLRAIDAFSVCITLAALGLFFNLRGLISSGYSTARRHGGLLSSRDAFLLADKTSKDSSSRGEPPQDNMQWALSGTADNGTANSTVDKAIGIASEKFASLAEDLKISLSSVTVARCRLSQGRQLANLAESLQQCYRTASVKKGPIARDRTGAMRACQRLQRRWKALLADTSCLSLAPKKPGSND